MALVAIARPCVMLPAARAASQVRVTVRMQGLTLSYTWAAIFISLGWS